MFSPQNIKMKQIDFTYKLSSAHLDSYLLEVDGRGRIVLPKVLRNKLNWLAGEKLVSIIDGNTLQITPAKAQIAKVQGILANISPQRQLAHELIAERRQEAKSE